MTVPLGPLPQGSLPQPSPLPHAPTPPHTPQPAAPPLKDSDSHFNVLDKQTLAGGLCGHVSTKT